MTDQRGRLSPAAGASTSEHLHQKRRLLSRRLWAASHRLWQHEDVAQMYPCLLFRSYCIARAAVSFLEAAAARLETMVGKDPAAAGLLEFLGYFTPEEAGHDEWMMEDLEELGVSRQEVLARVPPPAIAGLIGAQYYWVLHHHPVSVLGFFFLGETSGPRIDDVEDLIRRAGLPRAAFRNFLRHAVLDLKHGNDIERVIDELPLTGDHLSMIGVSLAHSIHQLALSTEEIVDLYEIRKRAGGSEAGRNLLY